MWTNMWHLHQTVPSVKLELESMEGNANGDGVLKSFFRQSEAKVLINFSYVDGRYKIKWNLVDYFVGSDSENY